MTGRVNALGPRRSLLSILALGVLLFAPAGSLRFWEGWLYGFVFVAATTAMSIYFLKHDPKLIERRMHVGPKAEQIPAQKIIMTITLLGFVMLLGLPGFDHRWQWSAVPPWLVLVANTGVALSFGIFFVVLKQNSYAASTIRVEAGQPVVSTGAYAIVRHPLYSGALLLLAFTPLALGSYWTLLVDGACAGLATSGRGTFPETEPAGLCRLLPRHTFSPDPGSLVTAKSMIFLPSAHYLPLAIP